MRRHSRTRKTATYTARETRHLSISSSHGQRPNSRHIILLNYMHLRQPSKRTSTQEDWTMYCKRYTIGSWRRQQRYKRDLDRRIKKIKRSILEDNYMYNDPADGMSKTGNPEIPALGPFRILKNDGRTVVSQRNHDVERIIVYRITYTPPPENAPPPEAFAPTGNDIAKNSEGPISVVENLLKHRMKSDGKLEFRAKWYGYTKQTWKTRLNTPEERFGTHRATKSHLEEDITDTTRYSPTNCGRDVHSLSGEPCPDPDAPVKSSFEIVARLNHAGTHTLQVFRYEIFITTPRQLLGRTVTRRTQFRCHDGAKSPTRRQQYTSDDFIARHPR